MNRRTRWRIKALLAAFALLMVYLPAYAERGEVFMLAPTPPGERPKHESEHSPKPLRSYWLSVKDVSPDAEAYFIRADGAVKELAVEKDEAGQVKVSVETPMEDGPAHGANNVYVIDRRVSGDTLTVRTAKWTAIQHSCGWGHGYRFDESRLSPRTLASAPLEVVCGGMWSENFHVDTQSGDDLSCRILSYGKPASGAKIKVRTGKGWVKELRADENGEFAFQLIKDYYPGEWAEFNRRHSSRLLIDAEYETGESGALSGKAYDRVKLTSTYPWRYSPSRRDYTSYSHGLAIGAIFLIVPAAGVYAYRERRKRPFKEVVFDEKH